MKSNIKIALNNILRDCNLVRLYLDFITAWSYLIKTSPTYVLAKENKFAECKEMLPNNAQVTPHHQANAQTPNYNSYEFFRAFVLKTCVLRSKYTKFETQGHKVASSIFWHF